VSIEIGITKQELTRLKRELKKPQEFICLDHDAYLRALLVGQHLATHGIDVKAKIVFKAQTYHIEIVRV
jgi:hypothetical protein